jgi:hypothetical protein
MRKTPEITLAKPFPWRIDQTNASSIAEVLATLPPHIAELLATLPVRAPRPELARLITLIFFQVSDRTLERWPVAWRLLNNRAHGEVAEVFAVAQRKLDEAPPIRGGSKAPPKPKAA